MEDCRAELAGLLLEEVSIPKDSNTLTLLHWMLIAYAGEQRLMGASLLIFSNKTDIEDCMTDREICRVRTATSNLISNEKYHVRLTFEVKNP